MRNKKFASNIYKELSLMENLFTKSNVCELGVTFLESGRKFSYDLKYDTDKKEYLYEKFVEILKDQYGNEKEVTWLLKDNENMDYYYYCDNEDLVKMIQMISQNGLVCYLVDSSKFQCLAEMKNKLPIFLDTNKICIICEGPEEYEYLISVGCNFI